MLTKAIGSNSSKELMKFHGTETQNKENSILYFYLNEKTPWSSSRTLLFRGEGTLGTTRLGQLPFYRSYHPAQRSGSGTVAMACPREDSTQRPSSGQDVPPCASTSLRSITHQPLQLISCHHSRQSCLNPYPHDSEDITGQNHNKRSALHS